MNQLSLLLSILILGYVIKVVYSENELLVIPYNRFLEDRMFKIITVVSILIATYMIITKGFKSGLLITLFSWCFFIVMTPMPEASIILTVPLKYMTKIPLARGHVIMSAVAMAIILTFKKYGHAFIAKTSVSGIFDYIMTNRLYHMIFFAVASSTILSKFANDSIDAYMQKDIIFLFNETNQNLAIMAFISIFLYIQSMYHYKVNIKY